MAPFRDFKNDALQLDKFKERHKSFIRRVKNSGMPKVNAFVNKVLYEEENDVKSTK
jgi:hypothetical protein